LDLGVDAERRVEVVEKGEWARRDTGLRTEGEAKKKLSADHSSYKYLHLGNGLDNRRRMA
jgi:hypothetical protein